ncbi:MAG: HEAT repeat domain-containing protein [Planctomycetes bacterium]|nr:HEAT repeat domain-containing protein [Planctomycetota bacterium]
MVNDSIESSELSELVAQLSDPHARRTARQRLVALGAVDTLLTCLESSNESVVWAAVTSLGELQAIEAAGPLLDLLQGGPLTLDVCEALTLISGQDFGADVKQWRKWLDTIDKGKLPGLDVQQCVLRTGELLGAEPAGSGNSYRFKLSLPDGRSQKVAVFFGRVDGQGDELVLIYSECGPADAKYYEAVLRKNLGIPAGAFAIRDIDGTPNFVMVDTMVAASVTPRVLVKKIENIAARADRVEKKLTSEDKR